MQPPPAPGRGSAAGSDMGGGSSASSHVHVNIDPQQQQNDEEQHSPFLQQLLRFSPHTGNNPGFRFSPKSSMTTTAGSTSAAAAAKAPTPSIVAAQHRHLRQHEQDEIVADGVPITKLRKLAKTSSYFASLLFAKTQLGEDALLLAKSKMSQDEDPSGCLAVLEESGLLFPADPPRANPFYWPALLLACKALAATEQWTLLLQVAEEACRNPNSIDNPSAAVLQDDDVLGWQALMSSIDTSSMYAGQDGDDDSIHPLAQVCQYRGVAYYQTGDSLRAGVYWKRAVSTDMFCQVAYSHLLAHQLVSPGEAYELLEGIAWTSETEWLRMLYVAAIEVNPQSSRNDNSGIPLEEQVVAAASNPNNILPSGTTNTSVQQHVDNAFDKLCNVHKLANAPTVVAMAAKRAYRRYRWKEALEYCQQLDHHCALTSPAAYVYVAVLTLLGHTRALFRLAHAWVEASPKLAQSWFAVGCYYYACKRYHVAQRHFCRATRLDPSSAQAWIAFGCSFAAVDESDQALASFRAAQRLAAGEHLSLLYMVRASLLCLILKQSFNIEMILFQCVSR